MAQLLSIIADIGLGASALYLAKQLTWKVQDHEKRIVVLEKRAA